MALDTLQWTNQVPSHWGFSLSTSKQVYIMSGGDNCYEEKQNRLRQKEHVRESGCIHRCSCKSLMRWHSRARRNGQVSCVAASTRLSKRSAHSAGWRTPRQLVWPQPGEQRHSQSQIPQGCADQERPWTWATVSPWISGFVAEKPFKGGLAHLQQSPGMPVKRGDLWHLHQILPIRWGHKLPDDPGGTDMWEARLQAGSWVPLLNHSHSHSSTEPWCLSPTFPVPTAGKPTTTFIFLTALHYKLCHAETTGFRIICLFQSNLSASWTQNSPPPTYISSATLYSKQVGTYWMLLTRCPSYLTFT